MDVFYNGLFKVSILSACAFSHYWAEQGTKVSATTPIQLRDPPACTFNAT